MTQNLQSTSRHWLKKSWPAAVWSQRPTVLHLIPRHWFLSNLVLTLSLRRFIDEWIVAVLSSSFNYKDVSQTSFLICHKNHKVFFFHLSNPELNVKNKTLNPSHVSLKNPPLLRLKLNYAATFKTACHCSVCVAGSTLSFYVSSAL